MVSLTLCLWLRRNAESKYPGVYSIGMHRRNLRQMVSAASLWWGNASHELIDVTKLLDAPCLDV